MNRNCLVSVATNAYLPKAFVMAKTFTKYNPSVEILILVPDMSQSQIDSIKWPINPFTKLLGLDALSNPLIKLMHKYYDAMELSCALKTFLMHNVLFVEGFDKVVMIDPDVMCYGPFDEIYLMLDNADVILTPHTESPMPEDGEMPDDFEFVTAGFINAGFMAARKSKNAEICLDWMVKKMSDFCFFSPKYNAYADQTWVSCLPWYFPKSVSVIRHAGINTAYWNLHERELTIKGELYFCNSQRLIFFHYSGFETIKPWLLTRNCKRTFSLENREVLFKLLSNYCLCLIQAESDVPEIIADSPCSLMPLRTRLQVFKLVRGKSVRFSIDNNSLTEKFYTLLQYTTFKYKQLIKKLTLLC